MLDGHWDDLDLDVRAIFDYFRKVMAVCVCTLLRPALTGASESRRR